MKWSAWAGHRNTCVGEVVCLFCRPSVDVDTHLGTANSAAEGLLSTWGCCSLVGSIPLHPPPAISKHGMPGHIQGGSSWLESLRLVEILCFRFLLGDPHTITITTMQRRLLHQNCPKANLRGASETKG